MVRNWQTGQKSVLRLKWLCGMLCVHPSQVTSEYASWWWKETTRNTGRNTADNTKDDILLPTILTAQMYAIRENYANGSKEGCENLFPAGGITIATKAARFAPLP